MLPRTTRKAHAQTDRYKEVAAVSLLLLFSLLVVEQLMPDAVKKVTLRRENARSKDADAEIILAIYILRR